MAAGKYLQNGAADGTDGTFRSILLGDLPALPPPPTQYPIDVSPSSPPPGIAANTVISRMAPQCGYLQAAAATQLQFITGYGDLIKIQGYDYQIPAGSVTAGLSNAGLAANTNYYVYLFNNGGTLQGEFSTTGPAQDATPNNVGTFCKGTDPSRSLIGFCFTNSSAQFGDSQQFRGVLSWQNRKPKAISYSFGNNNTSNVNATVGLLFGVGPVFQTWGDLPVTLHLYGQAFDNCGTGTAGAIGFGDNTGSTIFANTFIFGTNGIFVPWMLSWEGYFSQTAHTIFINGYANTVAAAANMQYVNVQLTGHVWG